PNKLIGQKPHLQGRGSSLTFHCNSIIARAGYIYLHKYKVEDVRMILTELLLSIAKVCRSKN
ncbi:MAG: hypothetical protein QXG05_08480, partial [Nitrososphaerota archaeon]